MPVMPGETNLHDLAPTRGEPTVHRSQVHWLGDTPIAIDLRSSSTRPSEQGKEKAMNSIRCREWGAPETLRLEKAESPTLQPHQVRIRVRAAGVNFADTLMVGGRYQVKPPFPFTPGLEAAGAGLSPAGSRQLRLTHRNRKFVDSLLEGDGFEPSVPERENLSLRAKGDVQAAHTARTRVPKRSTGAEQLVVGMKAL